MFNIGVVGETCSFTSACFPEQVDSGAATAEQALGLFILEGQLRSFAQSLIFLALQWSFPQCLGEIRCYERVLMEMILLFYFLP